MGRQRGLVQRAKKTYPTLRMIEGDARMIEARSDTSSVATCERWKLFPLNYHMDLPYLVLQSRIVFGV